MLVDGNHWSCFFVNLTSADFVYLDPRGADPEIENLTFSNWCNFCKTKNCLDKKWNILHLEHVLQSSTDIINCGIYVCYFLKILISLNLNLNFPNTSRDLISYRRSIKNFLLDNKI